MTDVRRQGMLIGLMLLMLAVGAGWSVNRMLTARAEAGLAAADRAEARRVAEAIVALRDQPAVAATRAMGERQLIQRIETAAADVGLPADALEGTFPQNARRVGDSPYLRKPTAITLRAVSLEQLTAFLAELTAESNLTVDDLRLRVPHGDNDGELWDAEATITYLIYSPPDDA